MTSVFCCGSVQTYRPQRLQHQQKFDTFITWATFPRASSQAVGDETKFTNDHPSFAVQHVQQVNFGPLESKRYFIPAQGNSGDFIEVAEADLIQANFQKLNSYKNWKCQVHNKFFETNLYQKNPTNQHHWRADIARPSDQIDL